jgi:hypothetical protein
MSKAKKERTIEEEYEVLQAVEDLYADMPEDASDVELLEMIAEATGESFETIHERFLDIKGK